MMGAHALYAQIVVSHPKLSKVLIHLYLSSTTASINGVLPSFDLRLISAPFWLKSLMLLVFPRDAAQCSADIPWKSWRLMFAPCWIINLARDRFSLDVASISIVMPYWSWWFTLEPFSSSSLKQLWPALCAAYVAAIWPSGSVRLVSAP